MKRTALLILACALAMGSGCRDTSGHDPSDESHGEHAGRDHHAEGTHEPTESTANSGADPSDWCGGHGLPESMCTRCNPELIPRFQASGDWCAEHEFPESACPRCNPMNPPGASASAVGADPSDWCGGHGLPESMCTRCNPELIPRFQASGDWCAEHEFPESACPRCNPMDPPSGPNAPADWCVEHGLPESMCPRCSPELAEQFQQVGDWCEEHGYPESACPICNPQRAPIGSVVGHAIRLTPEAIGNSEIRLGRVATERSRTSLTVPAEVQMNPDGVAHVSTLTVGQLQGVEAVVGDVVEEGQELATLRSVELGRARSALSRARAMRDVAEQNLERQRSLRDEGINSERSLLEAQLAYDEADAELDAAQSQLQVFGVRGGRGSDMELTSPIAGVVVDRHATRGENVSTDDTLFVIADMSELWVIGRVYEQDVAAVGVGMAATIEIDAFPGRTWSGTVNYLSAMLDEDTRSLPVRVEIDNTDGRLRPGLFGEMRLTTGSADGPVNVVPAHAVQTVNDQQVVFVPGDLDGEYVARAVSVGRVGPERAEILDGLRPGEEVVVAGAFVLKSELMRHALGEGCAH